MSARFWVDVALATLSAGLLVLSAAWPTWIEGIFEVEPDAGSGVAEWAIVAVLLVVSVTSALHARGEWRRAYAGE